MVIYLLEFPLLGKDKFELIHISVTENRLLNREDRPCEENSEYSLSSCVNRHQAFIVGCKPKWDDWENHGEKEEQKSRFNQVQYCSTVSMNCMNTRDWTGKC